METERSYIICTGAYQPAHFLLFPPVSIAIYDYQFCGSALVHSYFILGIIADHAIAIRIFGTLHWYSL